MPPIKDFAPRSGDIANDPDSLLEWLDSLGLRQNLDLLNALAVPAPGDKFGILDISASKYLSITYGVLLAGILAAVPAAYEEGTWTPADASGGSLNFANVSAYYQKVGKWIHFGARFDYPVTADVNNAVIGGLPYSVKNNFAAQGGVLVQHNGATATKFTVMKNNTTGKFITNADVAVTNAQMSNTFCQISGSYVTD